MDLALGQGEGRGQRRAWDAGANPLGLVTTMALSVPRANSDVLDENGEVKIVIEMAKAPKREDGSSVDGGLPALWSDVHFPLRGGTIAAPITRD